MIYKWGELIALEYGKPVKDKARTDGQYPVYGTNGQIGTSKFIYRGYLRASYHRIVREYGL